MRFGPALFFSFALSLSAVWADDSRMPPALRGVNPDWLSSGLYGALSADGVFGPTPRPTAADVPVSGPRKGYAPMILDARVGANVRLGADPAAVAASNPQQAEPHVARSASNPELLLATFQEGRLSDGGALTCGLALSQDGGLTWTRGLIPQLTRLDGGSYFRATDPVAAIGPQGDLYLNTLGALDNAFSMTAVVLSRSTDGGATWDAPVEIYRSPNAQMMADKNWLAVNDYPGAPRSGRLITTWTSFTTDSRGNATGNNLLASTSDNRGVTWTAPVAITPTGSTNQGSQPLFLPDGSLAVIYFTFSSITSGTLGSIQCKLSPDGGLTFPSTATTAVNNIYGWDDPQLRDGTFLPGATVARQTGALFISYIDVVNGSPRVLVVKSTDRGATWSTPAIVSDNPAGVSVMNPAIAVTPDGRTVTVVFYDKRNASDGANFVDLYAAQSFDGGDTWEPNLRLSDYTSDIRFGQATGRGYMLGDYHGLVASPAADVPALALWCDTRNGQSDPFTVRITPAAKPTFDTWRTARFSRAELADASRSSASADPDGDGYANLFEYALGTDPRISESGNACLVQSGTANITATLPANRHDAALTWETSLDGTTWTTPAGIPTVVALPPGQWMLVTQPDRANYFRLTAQPARGERLVSPEMFVVGSDGRLINVSTRGQVKTGASQLIVGFVVDGGAKQILLRGIGPTLRPLGVANAIADPFLRLYATGAAQPLQQNDNWMSVESSHPPPPLELSAAFNRLNASVLTSGYEAVLLTPLPAGAYTAILSDTANAAGVGLVEAYDADATPGLPSGPRLANLSTRGEVGTGGNALIAGFVLSGTQPRRVLIRAVGPMLSNFGVSGALADPVLTLHRAGTAAPIAVNDDWAQCRGAAATRATTAALGTFPLPSPSLDAALVLTLAPGSYSAVVTGADGATGIALVEVYDAN